MKPITGKMLLLILMNFYSSMIFSQNEPIYSSLPVNIIPAKSDSSKPFILYISGDGGWNKFSRSLSQEFANKGFPVVSLNANKYFWNRKSPQQTATDVSNLIKAYQSIWKKKKVILVGYSFGADVMPFVYNNLNKDLANDIVNISLLSPSSKTDFEIHIMVMLGGNSGGESVTKAINSIHSKPITLIFGEDENDFPIRELSNKNYVISRLTGGHHYDGDEATVAATVLNHISPNY